MPIQKMEKVDRVFEAPFFHHKLVATIDDLAELREGYRKLKKKVVLTQGVWDLLHRGHLRYLFAASQMGDVLIVGVDSDRLTRMRKGEGRPAVPEDERLEMLAFAPFIDHLILRRHDDDIGTLIQRVCPDVLVVSETTRDFPEKDVAVYEACCERIVQLAEQARTSTTERLRQEAITGEQKGKQKVIEKLEELIRHARESL